MPEHPSRLRARTLGSTDIEVDSRAILAGDWPSTKARSLLVLLLAAPGQRETQEAVIDALWPDLDPDAARNALYKAIHGLRRTLEPDLASARDSRFVQTRGGTISLVPESIAWYDVEAFERDIAEASTAPIDTARHLLRKALTLYRGDFADDDRYSDWPIPRREALRQARHRATLTLARLDLEADSAAQSIPFIDAVIASEPDAEALYRASMTAHAATGQPDLALREFERCRQALETSLGTPPSPETISLVGHIRAGMQRQRAVADRPQWTAFNNLPALPTRTIGREAEIDHLIDMFDESDARLVTVLGTGGVGKTRLAIESGADLAHRFPDGVAFVALSAVREPDRFFDTLAGTLGLEPDPRRPIGEVVLEALQNRNQLLVLDNFEHIIEAAGDVARLLEQCRNVQIVVTSREPLRVRAERLFRLEPLDLPDDAGSPRAIARNDSVALLVQSVLAHTPDFELTTANASTIARLCMRLEGLPLAIEIAAARCLDATPDAVFASLDQRMNALRDGPRDLPPRHRALRDTISWSYDLLSPDEQALFRRLGVFAGGVEPDALVAIGGPHAESVAGALVDKSLASWTLVDGLHRVGMLESIREYAVETLAAAREDTSTRDAHARFFVGLATGIEPELLRAGRMDLSRRLERDLPNIREALRFLLDEGPHTSAIALAGHLGAFWYTRGHDREGLDWLQAALAGGGDPAMPGVTSAAFHWAALCADTLGESEDATRMMEQAQVIAEQSGDLDRAGKAMAALGVLEFRGGRFTEANDLQENARRLLDTGRTPWASTLNLAHLARTIGVLGDDQRAVSTITAAIETSDKVEEGLQALVHLYAAQILFDIADTGTIRQHVDRAERFARLAGHTRQLALARYTSARLFEVEGEPGLAADALREAIPLFDASHDRRGGAIARLVLARIGLRNGIDSNSLHHIRLAIRELQSAGDVSNILAIQLVSAMMALHLDDHALAFALARSAHRLVSSRAAVMAPTYRDNFGRIEHQAMPALSPDERDAAIERGEALQVQEVFDIGLDLCSRAGRLAS